MYRLLVALAIPVPLLGQSVALPRASISVGGVTLSTNGRDVFVSARGGATTASRRSKPPAAVSARRVLGTADRYVGTRYAWGGTSPARGFDCSGFVQYVFARHEMELPRTSRQMAKVGRRVGLARREHAPGDLLFFAQNGTTVDHVAIYVGNGRIIHSSSSGGGVRYDDFSTKRGRWFAARIVGARRVIADGRSLVESLDEALRFIGEPLDDGDGAPAP